MKRTRIKPISAKEKARRKKWNELVLYLIQYRARGKCESCKKSPDFRGLQGHHIIKRSQGGEDEETNAIVLCGKCHAKAHYILEKD
ncbi:unnamed protein product [marine sediment metagenome]|uniref:HNH nuclease domain-containing protein n=1 Tax=marine sediment metagenome TaxID=412755 RepID=X0ZBK7_9ZZZZ